MKKINWCVLRKLASLLWADFVEVVQITLIVLVFLGIPTAIMYGLVYLAATYLGEQAFSILFAVVVIGLMLIALVLSIRELYQKAQRACECDE